MGKESLPLYAIVPAGGSGTRLWPYSRKGRPKFLLDPTHVGRSLIQQTCDRLQPLVAGISVITSGNYAASITRNLGKESAVTIVTEPQPRDSLAAIALVTAILHQQNGNCLVGSFPADHIINNQACFQTVVNAAQHAAMTGRFVTVGIVPTEASTAYGYIKKTAQSGDAAGAWAVESFKEKPDAQLAAQYCDSGDYYWNAGIFVFQSQVFLTHLAKLRPQVHAKVTAIAAAWDNPDGLAVLNREWADIEAIAIDYALAEPLAEQGEMLVVPAEELGWSDVGDFAALAQLFATGNEPVILKPRNQAIAIDAPGLVYAGDPGDTLVAIGIPDLVVARSGNVLLVTTKAHAQRVKEAPLALHEKGLDHLR